MAKDYYETLGLGRDASAEDIKRAYRKLAMKYHPDKTKGDPEAENRFKEAAEAYEVLSDPEKKVKYDKYGEAGLKGAFSGQNGGFSWEDFSHANDFEDIFGNIFGSSIFGDFFGGRGGRTSRGRRSAEAKRGSDLRVNVKLTLEDIAHGAEKKIKIKRQKPCPSCGGTGAKKGSTPQTCQRCGGTGELHTQSRSFFGMFINVQPCDVCHGEGQVVSDPCETCHGEGRVREAETIPVSIPAGVTSGNYIPLRGKGDVGPRNGPPGDIIVYIQEVEHDLFERHGDDVIYDLPISFTQAALGDKIEVPSLNGRLRLTVPAGTQSGKIFRMRGKGIPHLQQRGSGDQLVRVWVWTPTDISKEERELLNELGTKSHMKPPPGGKSFLKKRDH